MSCAAREARLILIVEDNEDEAPIGATLLNHAGYATGLARSADEAWEALRRRSPP